MTENRKDKRVKTRDSVSGKIILVEHLEILDLSLSGIHFNCLKKRRLEMNSHQTIKIQKDDISIIVHGLIVRATLKSTKENGTYTPIYDVAMKFSPLTSTQTASIEKLICLLGNE
ncbi:MAG: hypothetical protein A2X59_11545 [Nitrospirae bacterium GWC2_42_7]|nr:MAG: hypothetical protein A2X59_11545 [Nitrospirae bacterium GWC2_42_7]